MPSILTLDGLDQVDPYELPADKPAKPTRASASKPRVIDAGNYPVPRRTPKPKKIAKNPLPTNPAQGDCACRWNERKNRWVLMCFAGKGTGKGQTRSGWKITKGADEFCNRKPK